MAYTHKNLRDVEDMAARMGFGEAQEARFPMPDLDAQTTGVALIRVKPGKRQPFAHRHNEAEEIYVVLTGSGRVKVGDEIVEVTEMDAIRFDPEHGRAIEAGPDGIEVLAFGPRAEGDAEQIDITEFWAD
jgi:mannose-6-phosphate isomerase-like protein (cupin superfamily)